MEKSRNNMTEQHTSRQKLLRELFSEEELKNRLFMGKSLHDIPRKANFATIVPVDVSEPMSALKRFKCELEEINTSLLQGSSNERLFSSSGLGTEGYEAFLVYYLIESGKLSFIKDLQEQDEEEVLNLVIQVIEDFILKISKKDGEHDILLERAFRKGRPTIGIEVEHHSSYHARTVELNGLGINRDSYKEVHFGPSFSTKRILRQLLYLYKLKQLSTVTLHITVDGIELSLNHLDFIFVRLMVDAANFMPRHSLNDEKLDKLRSGRLSLREKHTKSRVPYHDFTSKVKRVVYGGFSAPTLASGENHMVQARSFSKARGDGWFIGISRTLRFYEYASIAIQAKQGNSKHSRASELSEAWDDLLSGWMNISQNKFNKNYPSLMKHPKPLIQFINGRPDDVLQESFKEFHNLAVAYGMSDNDFSSEVRGMITKFQERVKRIIGEKPEKPLKHRGFFRRFF